MTVSKWKLFSRKAGFCSLIHSNKNCLHFNSRCSYVRLWVETIERKREILKINVGDLKNINVKFKLIKMTHFDD